jgi:hypothetical protein
MRKFLLGLVLLAVAPLAAHASTINYNLILTPTSGNVAAGSGDLQVAINTVNFLETTTGPSTSGIQALSFSIGGGTFSLGTTDTTNTTTDTATTDFAEVSFDSKGNLTDIIFTAGISTFDMNVGAMTYTFVDGKEFSQGTVTSSIGPIPSLTAVPEPSSLVLLGSGLVGFAGFARRKFAR